jgi:hypothetical protein
MREDRRTLLSDETLPPKLRAILEATRTIQLAHGYDLEWSELGARSAISSPLDTAT